jgi:putative acetyltransferase
VIAPGPSIRPEEPSDRDAIRAVLVQAFGAAAEADLVDRLRSDGDLVLSLVAVLQGVVGHVAFSRLELSASPVRAVALAPVAVLPAVQRSAIGTGLVREGLHGLAASGEDLVLVVGDPAYYRRFGFSPEHARGLTTPYDGPYLQALAMSEAGRAASGPVRYGRAFADLG